MIITKVVTKTPDNLPPGWYDYSTPIEPFGANWGRGILVSYGAQYIAFVGGYSCDHADLKHWSEGYPIRKSFYFGAVDHTLYIMESSIGRDIEFNNEVVFCIMQAIETDPHSPLKQVRYKLWK